MSSDAVRDHDQWSRCLLCSLRCSFRIEESGPDAYSPAIPDEPHSGLCVRGMLVGDLIATTRRGDVLDARAGEERLPFARAVSLVQEALSACGGVDIVVDGTHRAEVLLSASRLAQENPGRIRSFVALPGEDALLLQNVWASTAEVTSFAALEAADGVLIIGDPFSGHPRSALPLLAFKRAQPRAPFLVIDSVAQRTSMFATHSITVAPQALPGVVACFAPDGTEGIRPVPSEPDGTHETIREAVEIFSRCERPVVVIESAPGRGIEWPLAGFVAGRVAAAREAGLVVLTQYGNASGATRFLASNAMLPVGDLMDEQPAERGVVLVGEDALCIPPHPQVESYVRSAKLVAQISLVPSRQFRGFHFPGVAFAEESGHVLAENGEWEFVPAAISAPAGVHSITDVLSALTAGEPIQTSQVRARDLPHHRELPAPKLVLERPAIVSERDTVGVMTSDPQHFVAGVFTATSRFLTEQGAMPMAVLSSEVGDKLHIDHGDEIIVASDTNECRAMVRLDDAQDDARVAITGGSQAVRRLFPFDLVDGLPIAKPTRVEIRSAKGPAA